MNKKIPAWLVLTVICVVAAMLLAATNLVTREVIDANAQKVAMETLGKLLPDAARFDALESGVSVGKDGSGNIVGYALSATTQGFGGEVETTVAALPDGVISGISVGGSNFAETAGLGARAKEPEFQARFAGKTAPVALTKDGGEIEALSGATITSLAVIKGVNEAMEGIAAEAGYTVESLPEPAQPEAGGAPAAAGQGGDYSAMAQGFGGPVRVFLTVDESRTITAIRIGDSEFAETEGLGARALEDEFQSQFIGKTVPLTVEDIDALTGATVTTTAVVDAINAAAAGFTVESLPEPAQPEAGGAPAAAGQGGNYSAKAQGFGGPVRVFLTVDESRTITAIRIGDSEFAETEGLGARALEDEFQSQFIGKTVPLTVEDIDALTGATVTTTAVVDAINAAAELMP